MGRSHGRERDSRQGDLFAAGWDTLVARPGPPPPGAAAPARGGIPPPPPRGSLEPPPPTAHRWERRPAEALRPAEAPLTVAGADLLALPAGALWWERERLLAVADLHLEKGSAFARRGEMLPPYDTRATLAALAVLVDRLRPAAVVSLGDSFHDDEGPARLSPPDRETLRVLQAGRSWVWIAGNHDAALPAIVGGERCAALGIGPLTFRHEPAGGPATGEIAGHLHPSARVCSPFGSVRRRCFVTDASRLILPAFGALTGGLNVLASAFAPLFSGGFSALVLGAGTVYPIQRRHLRCG